MMSGLQAAKKDLRTRIRGVLQTIPADSIAHQSRGAASKLFSLEEYRAARRIGVYLSMPAGELSTSAIVQDALATGKEVFVPYIHTLESAATQQKNSVMDMLALESMDEFAALAPDRWGIPSLSKEQAATKKNCLGGTGVSSAVVNPTDDDYGLDLIVMPGMAFDGGFRRLGHGKGYYDHFLNRYWKAAESQTATPKMPLLVALALKEQMLSAPDEIPVTSHDWLVDVLIVGNDRCAYRQR